MGALDAQGHLLSEVSGVQWALSCMCPDCKCMVLPAELSKACPAISSTHRAESGSHSAVAWPTRASYPRRVVQVEGSRPAGYAQQARSWPDLASRHTSSKLFWWFTCSISSRGLHIPDCAEAGVALATSLAWSPGPDQQPMASHPTSEFIGTSRCRVTYTKLVDLQAGVQQLELPRVLPQGACCTL